MRPPRLSPSAYRRVTLVALVALCFIVVTGAAVRLTNSGLGCPDWPSCYEGQFHAELQWNPMIEYVNRLVTGLVSVAVVVAVLGSLVRTPRRRDLTWLSGGLVAGVIAQIVLGGVTVLTSLTPPVVMAHFLLSMVLVTNAVVLHHRAGQPDGAPAVVPDRQVRTLAFLVLVGVWLALFTGTVVTGTGPHGGDEAVDRLSFYLPTVARVHGTTVVVTVAALLVTLWVMRRRGASRALWGRAELFLVAAVCQGALGYTQYFSGVPAGMVAGHVLGAVLVLVAATSFALATTERSVAAPPSAAGAADPPRTTWTGAGAVRVR